MEALSGRDDLLFAFGIALMSRSENYYRMPATPAPSSMDAIDWRGYGIHVRQAETVEERLRRIMQTPDPGDSQDYMQL